MTKAQTVRRIVKGPKPIHAYDANGKRHVYQIGEEVDLPPNAAKRFARYLTTPEVAKAEADVVVAEEKAAKAAASAKKDEAKPAPSAPAAPAPSPTAKPTGGGS